MHTFLISKILINLFFQKLFMLCVFYLEKYGKKAEEILKKDDICSRQSIALREAKTLGIDKEGYFLFFEGSEQACERAKELLKEFVKEVEEEVLEKVRKAYEEENEKALQGFGGIFG